MKAEKDRVVSFHYRLSEAGAGEIEQSEPDQPLVYLHGHDGIISGLEAAMAGRETGDKFSVTIAPEQAYGARRDDAIQRVQRKYIAGKAKLRPGMVVSVGTDKGPRQVVVVKAGKFVVDVDTNHPLAGKTLTFDVEISDIREASSEELAHGHAHGPGGHHH